MRHYFRDSEDVCSTFAFLMRPYYFRETVRMCDVLCGKDKCLSRLTHPPPTLHSLHTLSQTRIIISIYKCAFVFATVALKYCHYLDDHKDFVKMWHQASTRRGWVRVWSWAVSQFCKIYTNQFIKCIYMELFWIQLKYHLDFENQMQNEPVYQSKSISMYMF